MCFVGYSWLQLSVCRPQSSGTMVRFSSDPLSVEKMEKKGELLCSRILPKHRMRMNTGPKAGQPMVTARNGGGQRVQL